MDQELCTFCCAASYEERKNNAVHYSTRIIAVITNSSFAETVNFSEEFEQKQKERKEKHEKKCSTSYERSVVLNEACYLDQMQKAGGLTDRHQRKYERTAKFYCKKVSRNPS